MHQNVTVFLFRQLSHVVFATTAAASVSFCWGVSGVFLFYIYTWNICVYHSIFHFGKQKGIFVVLQQNCNMSSTLSVFAGALVVPLDHCHTLTQTKHIVSKRTVVCLFLLLFVFVVKNRTTLEWTLLLTLQPIFAKIPWRKKRAWLTSASMLTPVLLGQQCGVCRGCEVLDRFECTKLRTAFFACFHSCTQNVLCLVQKYEFETYSDSHAQHVLTWVKHYFLFCSLASRFWSRRHTQIVWKTGFNPLSGTHS